MQPLERVMQIVFVFAEPSQCRTNENKVSQCKQPVYQCNSVQGTGAGVEFRAHMMQTQKIVLPAGLCCAAIYTHPLPICLCLTPPEALKACSHFLLVCDHGQTVVWLAVCAEHLKTKILVVTEAM